MDSDAVIEVETANNKELNGQDTPQNMARFLDQSGQEWWYAIFWAESRIE